jgi:GAF domain-containing protein/HAMP domain-containing protein/CHASE3 domain sensor protein
MNNKFFSPTKLTGTQEKKRAAELFYQTASENSPETRRFGFWRNLRLARKLLLAFGILFIFTIIIAFITLSGLNDTQASYDDALAQGIEIRRLSNQLKINLLQARENERDFLLNWRKEGFDTAYANYAIPHAQNVALMRNRLAQLADFGPAAASASSGITTQAQYEADIAILAQNVDTYEKNFTTLVDAYHKKGFDENTDFESQFRTAAGNMEFGLFYGQLGVDQIKITYLRLRFSEKNYLADANPAYAIEVHSFIPLMKDLVASTDKLQPREKTELLTQADVYLTAFDQLVELDKEIAAHNKELSNAASSVEFLATKIERLGNQLAQDGIDTAKASSARTYTISVIAVFVVLAASILLAIGFSQQLTRPIILLTRIAQEISEGNFHMQAQVNSADEIGTLTRTFNNMTVQLRSALQNLESRATELKQQTVVLEHTNQESKKRTRQLQTIAEIARYISAEKDLKKLLPLITQTVSEELGFYHVGIFLLDDSNRFAVLLAANSTGGQKMLQRRHSLEVGQTGIVGNVTATGKPRIALDTGMDAVYFNNPDLPQTRSEMALPLHIEGRVIGALDIQSTEINAFSEEDVEALTALADQVSIAIENARLFNQIERSLVEADAIQRQYLRETWGRLPKEEKLGGYRYSIVGAVPLEEELAPADQEYKKDRHEVNVPIILRGETIGTLSVQTPKNERISADQMDLVKAVAERVALSAENARLFDETTRRAERERIVSDIASKIGASFRTESILRTTAAELSQLLEDADIFINLQAPTKDNKDTN